MNQLVLGGIKQLRDIVTPTVIDTYPVNPKQWDTHTISLATFDSLDDWWSLSLPELDRETTFEGRPTVKIDGSMNHRYHFPKTIDLSGFDYVDVWVQTSRELVSGESFWLIFRDIDNVETSGVAARSYIYRAGTTRGFVPVRINLHRNTTSNIDFSQIKDVRFVGGVFSSVTWHLAKMEAVSVDRALLMIGFDDQHASVYNYAFVESMKPLGIPGTFFVHTGNVSVSEEGGQRVTWRQLAEMAEAGWLIASHTHTNILLNSTEHTPEEKIINFQRAKHVLNQFGHQRGAPFLAYVGGVGPVEPEVRDAIFEGTIFRRGSGSLNNSYAPVGRPLRFGDGYSVGGSQTVESVIDAIDEAIANKEWLTLQWHVLVDRDPVSSTEWHKDDFAEVCQYVADCRDRGDLGLVTPYDLFIGQSGPVIKVGASYRVEAMTDKGVTHIVLP